MGIVGGVLIALMGVLILMIADVMKRLPPAGRSPNIAQRPSGSPYFALWIEVEETWGAKFHAGLLDGWQSGLDFELHGSADGNENLPGITRATVNVSSSTDMELRKSEVFGRGNVNEKSVELFVWLSSADVTSLLWLLKTEPKVNAHLQGYIDEGGKLRVTVFECEQRL